MGMHRVGIWEWVSRGCTEISGKFPEIVGNVRNLTVHNTYYVRMILHSGKTKSLYTVCVKIILCIRS